MYEYTNKFGELGRAINDVATKLVDDDLKQQFDAIAEFRTMVWNNRKISSIYSNGYSQGNLGDAQKLEAKIPGQILRAALWVNPNLLKDDKAWAEFLDTLPPICDFRKKTRA